MPHPRRVLAVGVSAVLLLSACDKATSKQTTATPPPVSSTTSASASASTSLVPVPPVTGDPTPFANKTFATVGDVRIDVDAQTAAGDQSVVRLTFTRAGSSLRALQPLAGEYAPTTALSRDGKTPVTLTPHGVALTDNGGPIVALYGVFPSAGVYDLTVRFKIDGAIRTAKVALTV